ncbi:T9SS type A sorting domain-containing protein [Microvirga sp. STR05]|uniref:T9SS type A sorting domain-containing protein n=1 Tax=Hymenobacter duratus TaxID=2771356 RepID=A0ABR8JCE8_9BACT|nr:CARDB domain-containing protein [Hymenobacter duratus]MBD2714457.1 T9SS type A sorting domain-containing protein [Hymenobacter duratus]MBR7949361.1 T9SS type A sorting domain-containing protein [Microvirga sp. STR05]
MKKILLSCWLLVGLIVSLKAQNRPDLIVVAPYSLPTAVQAGGTYTMSAHIRVNGNPGAGAQFNCVGYYLSANSAWDATDAYLGSSCQGLLMAGQSGPTSITAIIPALVSPGGYYLVLVADPLNAELESDETNNVVTFPVQVTSGTPALPDLELWRPSISFSTVPAGGNTGAFSFIFNRGAGGVGAHEVGFYLSADTVFSASTDVFMGQITGGSLAGASNGSTGTGTVFSAPLLAVPATTAPGSYYLLLVIDQRNLIAESNENNNSRALRLVVTGTLSKRAVTASEEALQVYPNPAASGSGLKIRTGAAGPAAKLTLTDAMGRTVMQQTLQPAQTEASLDTRRLPAGIYLVRLTAAGVAATRRVVIN